MKLLKLISFIFICLVVAVFLFNCNPAYAITISPPRFDELALVPGQEINKKIIIYNEDKISKVYTFDILNFVAQDETGSPKFINKKEGLASWIILPTEKITIGPDEVKNLDFKISVPKGAKPGGYYAAVFLVGGFESSGDSGEIIQREKIGSLILGQVPGEVKKSAVLKEFKIIPEDKKFFSYKPKGFSALFENTGGLHLRPDIKLSITNFFGATKDSLNLNLAESYILPDSQRRFNAEWSGAEPSGFWQKLKAELKEFGFGRYEAKLLLSDKELKLEPNNYLVFWIVPWRLILAVVILVSILVILVKFYNKNIIRKAKRQ